jgi:hypothetical protein
MAYSPGELHALTHCHGLMVVDHFLDLEDAGGHLWLRSWRCVNCGAVVEPQARRQHASFAAGRLHARLSGRPLAIQAVPLGV